MSIEIKMAGTIKNGEILVSTVSTTAWEAGQPVCEDHSGMILCHASESQRLLGLALTDRTTAAASGSAKCAYVAGGGIVEVWSDTGLAAAAPYDTTRTYSAGDPIYVNDDGLLTNDPQYAQRNPVVTGEALTGQDPLAIVLEPVPTAVSSRLRLQLRI